MDVCKPATFASTIAVAMATSDKHSQTFQVKSGKITEITTDPAAYAQVMYDDTVAVDAREVSSPSSDDEETPASKFRPPPRQTARHDFGSASDSESDEEHFLGQVEEMRPLTEPRRPEPVPAGVRPPARDSKPALGTSVASSDNSDSDSGDPAAAGPTRRRPGVVIPAEGAYDPDMFRGLQVPPEMEAVFQYITKYTPQKIEIEFRLQPFVPDFVPAVGDIDAFLKVSVPAAAPRGAPLAPDLLQHIDNLGLTVLDEPAAEQSDSALLQLQIRARSRSAARATVLTKKVESAERQPRVVERWVRDVSALHASRPPPDVLYTSKMPDLDALMDEWPAAVEAALNDVGVPPPSLDCSLTQYAALLCALLDIPVEGGSRAGRVHALHALFSLYAAARGTQLYADRERERGDGGL